jgi:hypothetical protein
VTRGLAWGRRRWSWRWSGRRARCNRTRCCRLLECWLAPPCNHIRSRSRLHRQPRHECLGLQEHRSALGNQTKRSWCLTRARQGCWKARCNQTKRWRCLMQGKPECLMEGHNQTMTEWCLIQVRPGCWKAHNPTTAGLRIRLASRVCQESLWTTSWRHSMLSLSARQVWW